MCAASKMDRECIYLCFFYTNLILNKKAKIKYLHCEFKQICISCVYLTYYYIVISILNRIGYVLTTVNKNVVYVGFIDSLTMVYRRKLRLINIPLYEDMIGEVLFDVFYFEFPLLICDNEML